VIKLIKVFERRTHIYLILELLTGGELFDKIVEHVAFTEEFAAALFCKIVRAVDYLHSVGIVHRDLKPENLLFASPALDAEIKIADFGLSKSVGSTKDAIMKTACGTPGYVAPEILGSAGYGAPVDMWSCGVILYVLLCGFPPFYAEHDRELFDLILGGSEPGLVGLGAMARVCLRTR
jgi:calcium/calmodulin-dependent protein kinase I